MTILVGMSPPTGRDKYKISWKKCVVKKKIYNKIENCKKELKFPFTYGERNCVYFRVYMCVYIHVN